MCMMWPEFELGSYGVRFMYHCYLTLLTHFCLFTTLKMNSRCWTASDFLNWRKWHENIPPGPQKGLCLTSRGLMYVEHLTGWGITLYCHSGPRNLNQRNKGNSPVTLSSREPAPSPSWCISLWSQLLRGRTQRGRSLVKPALAVHSFLPAQVPKTPASQRWQEPQNRFREVRGWFPGCCLNSLANVGPASWCSPHLLFLEKPWPALPSPWVFLQWVPGSHNIPNTVSPGILLTPLWILAKQTFVFPLFLSSRV